MAASTVKESDLRRRIKTIYECSSLREQRWFLARTFTKSQSSFKMLLEKPRQITFPSYIIHTLKNTLFVLSSSSSGAIVDALFRTRSRLEVERRSPFFVVVCGALFSRNFCCLASPPWEENEVARRYSFQMLRPVLCS